MTFTDTLLSPPAHHGGYKLEDAIPADQRAEFVAAVRKYAATPRHLRASIQAAADAVVANYQIKCSRSRFEACMKRLTQEGPDAVAN